MRKNVPDYISFPLLGAIGGTLLFVIPLIGPLLSLPLIPLVELYDHFIPGNFGQTGEHVEVGYAWITLKTVQAWMFYASFFFLIGLVIGMIKHAMRGKRLQFVACLILVYVLAIGFKMIVV